MGSSPSIKDILGELEKDLYISLLSKLIGESKFVQNNPPDLVPEEDKVANHVLDVLRPLSTENGGLLEITQVCYCEHREHLIVKYPGTEPNRVVSFVGSHFDVVTADEEDPIWVLFFTLILITFFVTPLRLYCFCNFISYEVCV
ncbi:acetylornithine deacetylase-like [Momordica charantia]|uniref:Acetylornithine deacetylase-like n=1 Tax=Momordica charantia TaxID=3673 RepID=A0A6J1E3Z9_MOMCH|nr:acetylornithine deacetylase-like [Momordica charantia]XP_022159462.1 acetylornithine deacetylase-like [Momordica charantia]